MAIDKLPSGRYRSRVFRKGRIVATETFRKLADARAWEARQVADLESRRARGLVAGRTLKELVAEFLDNAPAIKSDSDRRQRLKWWVTHFGTVRLSEFDAVTVGDGVRKLRGRAGQTVRNYANALSAAMQYGVRIGWLSFNPVRSADLPSPPPPRVRTLDAAQAAALLDACRKSRLPDLWARVALSLHSGCRRGELAALKWHHVDREARCAILGNSKAGTPRVIAIPADVLAWLESQPRQISGHLFKPGVPVRWAFQQACKAAGLTGFRWHDMRHAAASRWAAAGASLLEIQQGLGHGSLTATSRYAHLTHVASVVDMAEGRERQR